MKEIKHTLTERDLRQAVYQFLQGLSEDVRPRSPGKMRLEFTFTAEGEKLYSFSCDVVEIRDDE